MGESNRQVLRARGPKLVRLGALGPQAGKFGEVWDPKLISLGGPGP